MAPTTTSISTSMLMATASYPPTAPPTPSSSFDGDEFSNNLFSDLAPLLTLFGEQVTKQFLSLSMGWADNILLAMGPLGIITTVVSAIRVGGKRGLKTLVGRARESISAAEAELLSSTSADVCEVWSGQEVVRQYGVPDTKEMIIVLDYDTSRVLGLVDACSKKYLREAPNQIVKDMQTYSSVALSELANGAPNITLNIRGSTVSKYELWFYTALGIVCQTVALVIPALGTYYWNWPKGDFPAPSYGYPCYAIGSGLIIAGLVFCSHIIEASTSEQDFIRNKPEPTMQVLRLQRACTVSDQHFGSYAIFNAPGDVCLRTSRLNNHRKGTTAAISSMMTIAGFICQFVGLRALHWSATIILLGATLVTTWARMSARRGLLLEPLCLPLPEGQEVPWLALFISRHLHLTSQQATGAFQSATQIRDDATPTRNEWEIVTGGYQANFKKSLARYAIAYNARNARSAYQGCSDLNEAIPPGVNPSADVVAACSRSNMATNLVNDKEAITLSVSMASDISKLMPIPKGSDNHVYQLSLAIETVTNLVAGPGLDLTAGPFTCFCWRHRASHKSTQSGRSVNGPSGSPASTQHTKILYAPYSFVVSRNLYSNNWKSDETCLRSVCSLWTHSLMSRRRLYDQEYMPSLATLQRRGGTHPEQGYLRVVGSSYGLESLDKLRSTLTAWTGVILSRVTKPDGDCGCLPAPTAGYFSRPTIPHVWPVFGLPLSSMWDDLDAGCLVVPANKDTADLDTRTDLHNSLPYMEGDLQFESGNELFSELAFASTNSIETECAVELFASFFLELASNIHRIDGTTAIIDNPVVGEGIREGHKIWQNSEIDSIVKVMMTSAPVLFPTEYAAKITIIPALARHNLLPTELSNSKKTAGESPSAAASHASDQSIVEIPSSPGEGDGVGDSSEPPSAASRASSQPAADLLSGSIEGAEAVDSRPGSAADI